MGTLLPNIISCVCARASRVHKKCIFMRDLVVGRAIFELSCVQIAQACIEIENFVVACDEKYFWGIDIVYAPCYNNHILFIL